MSNTLLKINLTLCEYLQKERHHKKFILYICENNENKRLNKRKKKLHLGKNYLTSDKKIKNNALNISVAFGMFTGEDA